MQSGELERSGNAAKGAPIPPSPLLLRSHFIPPSQVKRGKLPNPLELSTDALTLPIFCAYIKQFLQFHHLTPVVPSSRPSSPSNAPFPLQTRSSPYSSDAFNARQPIPFTLTALERDRTLQKFVARFAHKLERDKRSKKLARRGGPVPFANKTYVNNTRGAARILPPVGGGRVLGKDAGREREKVLEGDALLRAKGKAFREALKMMRQRGAIVVCEEGEGVLPPVGLSPLRFESSYRGEREADSSRTEGGRQAGGAPWALAVREDEPGEEVWGRPPPFELQLGSAGGATPRRAPGPPPLLFAPDDPFRDTTPRARGPPPLIFADPDGANPFRNATPRASTSRRPGQAPWDLQQEELPPSSPAHPNNVVNDPTPRPIRTFPPAPATRSPGMKSWTTSIAGMDPDESFLLVTTALLLPVVRNLLVTAPAGSIGFDEEGVRDKLARRDGKWEAVAKGSSLVRAALEELEDRGEAVKKGERWRAAVRSYDGATW